MNARLTKEFTFEAAHRLPKVPVGHKCARLHGHSYQVELSLTAAVNEETGMVVDFDDLRAVFEPIRKKLDHYYLNEIEGLENPTSELLARWIHQRILKASLWQHMIRKQGFRTYVFAVTVKETCTSSATYSGD
jgi:6-pyruvoyltetrahydropterin/6-carboxytetrahydropterin synthase